jgi:hypothetical protein
MTPPAAQKGLQHSGEGRQLCAWCPPPCRGSPQGMALQGCCRPC